MLANVDELFAALRSEDTHDTLLASGRCTVAAAQPELNRYSDCWPLDAHLCDTSGAGYLNASLIAFDAAGGLPTYIAAAGPMAPEWHGPDTRMAFWSAVLHHRVRVLVALARPADPPPRQRRAAPHHDEGLVEVQGGTTGKKMRIDSFSRFQHSAVHPNGSRIGFWPCDCRPYLRSFLLLVLCDPTKYAEQGQKEAQSDIVT